MYIVALGVATLVGLIALVFLTFVLVSAGIIIRRSGDPFKDAL